MTLTPLKIIRLTESNKIISTYVLPERNVSYWHGQAQDERKWLELRYFNKIQQKQIEHIQQMELYTKKSEEVKGTAY